MKTILKIIVVLIAIVVIILAFRAGSERQRIVECLKLEQQAQEYPGFFYADWQETMCEK